VLVELTWYRMCSCKQLNKNSKHQLRPAHRRLQGQSNTRCRLPVWSGGSSHCPGDPSAQQSRLTGIIRPGQGQPPQQQRVPRNKAAGRQRKHTGQQPPAGHTEIRMSRGAAGDGSCPCIRMCCRFHPAAHQQQRGGGGAPTATPLPVAFTPTTHRSATPTSGGSRSAHNCQAAPRSSPAAPVALSKPWEANRRSLKPPGRPSAQSPDSTAGLGCGRQ